jgi:hypothetical protein
MRLVHYFCLGINLINVPSPVNGDEQEQPDNINKMSISCSGFKGKVVIKGKSYFREYKKNVKKENCANYNVYTMKSSRHKESSAVSSIGQGELSLIVL